MTHREKSKHVWLSLCAAVLATAAVGMLAFCSMHGVWSRDEWFVYQIMVDECHQIMVDECHPVWTDYHFGKIRAGDDVAHVIATTNPSIVTRNGNSVTLEYYQDYRAGAGSYLTGLVAEAQNGKLVCAYAYSCEWTRQFFDTVGKEESYFAFEYRRLPRGGAISKIYGY